MRQAVEKIFLTSLNLLLRSGERLAILYPGIARLESCAPTLDRLFDALYDSWALIKLQKPFEKPIHFKTWTKVFPPCKLLRFKLCRLDPKEPVLFVFCGRSHRILTSLCAEQMKFRNPFRKCRAYAKPVISIMGKNSYFHL